MKQIYRRKRLSDFRKYWLNHQSLRNQAVNHPFLLSERLEDRIVLAAPTAMDDAASTMENSTVDINVLMNDTDPDMDMLSVSEINSTAVSPMDTVMLASGASVTLNMDGTLTYDPGTAFDFLAVSESFMDSFDYQISDGTGEFATATVTVTINGVNDPPVVDTLIADQMSNDADIISLDVSGNSSSAPTCGPL